MGTNFRFPEQTAADVHGAFRVLTSLEDLTIVSCQTEPFFSALGVEAGDGVLLPGLRRLTAFVGYGDFDVSALIRSAKTRKEHFRPLVEMTIVFDEEPEAELVKGVELLREVVGELAYRVEEAPELYWLGEDCDPW